MLAHLIHRSTFGELPPGDTPGEPLWLTVLKHAVAEGVHALIDVGALLAGQSNTDIARTLCTLQAKPVTFFDATALSPSWVVINAINQRWELVTSPVQERDTFVVFDQARCRGADLKLLPHAVAMVTLSGALCKDALIQAAGRMRGLDFGQRLRLVATREVAALIRERSVSGRGGGGGEGGGREAGGDGGCGGGGASGGSGLQASAGDPGCCCPTIPGSHPEGETLMHVQTV